MESWNGEQSAGSKGVGRIGANVDSNPRPRWAIDRKIYLDEVGGANHPLPCSSTAHLPIALPHALPASTPRKSHRLTFCSSSVRGIKFGREVVSNILCSDSALRHGWDRIPTLAPRFRDYHHVTYATSPYSLSAKIGKRTRHFNEILSFRWFSNCILCEYILWRVRKQQRK